MYQGVTGGMDNEKTNKCFIERSAGLFRFLIRMWQ